MADISDVIRADGVHILCWQARLGQLRASAEPDSRAEPARGPDLAATWDTVTTLIELHARAEEEVHDPAIYDGHPRGKSLAGQVRDARQDIREIIGETGLQPSGSPRWWELAGSGWPARPRRGWPTRRSARWPAPASPAPTSSTGFTPVATGRATSRPGVPRR